MVGLVSSSQLLSGFHHFTTNRLSSPSPKTQTNASEKGDREKEGEVGEGEEERFDEKVVNSFDIDRTNFQHFNFQKIATS